MHEKSVLLMLAPAAPLLLLDPHFFCWVQVLCSFTMFPLLIKDKLRLPYLACCTMYVAFVTLLDGAQRGEVGSAETTGAPQVHQRRSWVGFVVAVQDWVASKTVKTLLLVLAWTGALL